MHTHKSVFDMSLAHLFAFFISYPLRIGFPFVWGHMFYIVLSVVAAELCIRRWNIPTFAHAGFKPHGNFSPHREKATHATRFSLVHFHTIVTMETDQSPLKTLEFFHLPLSSMNFYCVKAYSLRNSNLPSMEKFIPLLFICFDSLLRSLTVSIDFLSASSLLFFACNLFQFLILTG